MKASPALIAMSTPSLLLGTPPVLALNPSLDVSQYAHNAWSIGDGFFKGNIYSIAQTPDGYLWLGTEFGLFASMVFAVSPGNHPRVSISLTITSTGYSPHATALSGLARLQALQCGVAGS